MSHKIQTISSVQTDIHNINVLHTTDPPPSLGGDTPILILYIKPGTISNE